MKLFLQLLVFIFISISNTNGQHWEPVGGGTDANGLVFSLYEMNGTLVVSGSFDSIGGGTIYSELTGFWNGSNWSPSNWSFQFGSPLDYEVYQNKIYSGGNFSEINGNDSCRKIARLESSGWEPLGLGITSGSKINCLKVFNGDLYVGGQFTEVNNISANRIARWNGVAWSAMGTGFTGGFGNVNAMEIFNGQLYFGGFFGNIDGLPASGICRWNGIVWDSVGTGMNGPVNCLYVDSINNRLYVGGQFTEAGGVSTPTGIAYWDGNNWFAVGANPYIPALDLIIYQGILYNASTQSSVVNSIGDTIHYLAWFDGQNWNPVSGGVDATAYEFEIFQNELYIGGVFSHAEDSLVNGIVKWIPGTLVIPSSPVKIFDWKLFPNPTNDYLIFDANTEIKGTIDLEFIDINGRCTMLKKINSTESTHQPISLYPLTNGTYIVNLFINNMRVDSKSIVISR